MSKRTLALCGLVSLLAAETVDEKAVLAKAEQLSELQGAALRGLVRSRVAVRRILSADQARAFEQLLRRSGRGGAEQGLRSAGAAGREAVFPAVQGEAILSPWGRRKNIRRFRTRGVEPYTASP